MQLNSKQIQEIIERRLLNVPGSIKQHFPDVVKDEVRWVAYSDDFFSMLVFLDNSEMERVKRYSKRGLQLFPGLVTTQQEVGAGMRMENSKYGMVTGCTVSGMYSFSIGENSSFVIENHTQELKTNELGDIKYTVPLAYVVSYGHESVIDEIYDNLDDLISYSIKKWREVNDPS